MLRKEELNLLRTFLHVRDNFIFEFILKSYKSSNLEKGWKGHKSS